MWGVLSAPDAVAIAAMIAGVPSTIAAVASVRAARQAGAANRAVNDVGQDEPKLRQIVKDIDEAQRTQSAQLGRIEGELRDGASRMGSIESGVAGLHGRLSTHLAWHQTEAEQGGRVADAQLDSDDDSGQS